MGTVLRRVAHVMLFALLCDLALVSFVRRVCFGMGRDTLTIRIGIKQKEEKDMPSEY